MYVRMLASKGIDILCLSKMKVGNGEDTSFWYVCVAGDFPTKATAVSSRIACIVEGQLASPYSIILLVILPNISDTMVLGLDLRAISQ
ncbi:hypothetical protein Tco_0210018 [Tanacetum coccineum]